jgi:hypothetical protein
VMSRWRAGLDTNVRLTPVVRALPSTVVRSNGAVLAVDRRQHGLLDIGRGRGRLRAGPDWQKFRSAREISPTGRSSGALKTCVDKIRS